MPKCQLQKIVDFEVPRVRVSPRTHFTKKIKDLCWRFPFKGSKWPKKCFATLISSLMLHSESIPRTSKIILKQWSSYLFTTGNALISKKKRCSQSWRNLCLFLSWTYDDQKKRSSWPWKRLDKCAMLRRTCLLRHTKAVLVRKSVKSLVLGVKQANLDWKREASLSLAVSELTMPNHCKKTLHGLLKVHQMRHV